MGSISETPCISVSDEPPSLNMNGLFKASTYRICRRCVMDSNDPHIEFDANGICNYCKTFLARLRNESFVNNRTRNIDTIVAAIKQSGRGQTYDSIIGVSGGTDSSFVAYLVKKHGLRPLAVHLDNGWNSELAVDNIQKILNALEIDLYTYVINWEEFRNLQMSFIKAGVTNIEIPSDHAINATLQAMAVKWRVKYIISGSNLRSEGITPRSFGWYNIDLRHLRAIHRRFGTQPLKTFPQIGLVQYGYNALIKGIRTIPILNYIDYSKPKAVEVLKAELGWRSYGGKHYESIITRFFQGYILPRKFGVDKRRPHLSSLIAAGDISRSEAITELERDPYVEANLAGDKAFFLKKLGMTDVDFEEYMASPPRKHEDYPRHAWFFERFPKLKEKCKAFAMRG
jgi:N-acetyl sugar amidotransferase